VPDPLPRLKLSSGPADSPRRATAVPTLRIYGLSMQPLKSKLFAASSAVNSTPNRRTLRKEITGFQRKSLG
jgi:hypothetical protein